MILAIDPGSEQSAYVLWDGERIVEAKIEDNELLAIRLRLGFDTYVELHIEWISSYGMRVGSSIFETCYWVGVFDECWHGPATRTRRIDIKRWHTGRPSSKDADVSGALKEKYGEKGTKKNPGLTYPLKKDLWQAFALATFVTEGGLEARAS